MTKIIILENLDMIVEAYTTYVSLGIASLNDFETQA